MVSGDEIQAFILNLTLFLGLANAVKNAAKYLRILIMEKFSMNFLENSNFFLGW
jgi:hypothetical protein